MLWCSVWKSLGRQFVYEYLSEKREIFTRGHWADSFRTAAERCPCDTLTFHRHIIPAFGLSPGPLPYPLQQSSQHFQAATTWVTENTLLTSLNDRFGSSSSVCGNSQDTMAPSTLSQQTSDQNKRKRSSWTLLHQTHGIEPSMARLPLSLSLPGGTDYSKS